MIASKERRFARSGALGLLLAALLLAGTLTEESALALPILYVVNSTADPGNGLCNASECTLREAINEANDTPEKDTIHFGIAGGGVKTIKPSSELPEITEAVTIDGYSQLGASENTLNKGTNAVLKIELNGQNAGGTYPYGLWISAPDSVVRGLVINRFDGSGVKVGSHPGDEPPDPQDTRVVGNFIGTDTSGTLDRGNHLTGVYVSGNGGNGNTIGGNTPEARNLISGNDRRGVYIYNANRNEIKGNLIGTKKDGTGALGNSGSGVRIFGSAYQNVVGGNTAAAANTIAFNHGDGVVVDDETFTTRNSILRNSIFANIDEFPDGLAVDLGNDGPTPNDLGDADTGPNNLQNFPVLSSAENSGGETTIDGIFNSKPNQTFTVRFFSNPSGSEGKKYIGSKSVTTNLNGNASFTFKPENKVPVERTITATATDPAGNTSEFSASEEVVT